MSRIILAAVTAVLLSTGVAFAASSITAHGTADQEVPAVDSKAQSQATFKLSGDGQSLSYKLNVSQLDRVKFAHIHRGARGANGPVVAFLLAEQPNVPGVVNGRLAEGVITAGDLKGPLAGQPLSALVSLMNDGNAYTNVHTYDVPSGEVRGQTR